MISPRFCAIVSKSNATCLRYFLAWGLVADFTAILGINWCSVHDCTRSMQRRRCPTPREKPRAPCPTCCSNGVAAKAWERTSEKLFFKNPAKHLAVSEIVRTFASLLRTTRALSSAGSERLPYKQRVGGSNPSAPTPQVLNGNISLCKMRALSSAGSERLPYKQRVGGSNPSAPTTHLSTSCRGDITGA